MKHRKLPRSISKEARDLISFLYTNFKKTGKWTGFKTLRIKLTPEHMDRLSRKYEPALFKKSSDALRETYQLTALGLLKCSEAKEDIELLERFTEFLKQHYINEPEKRYISAVAIREQLKLTQGQTDTIRVFASILLHGYDVILGENWQIEVPFDVELLVHKMSVKEYIFYKIQQRYDLDKTNFPDVHVDKLNVAFWVIVVTQVSAIAFIIHFYVRSALPYLATACIWMTLFSITKILQLYKINHRFVSPEKILDKVLWYAIQAAISVSTGFITNLLFH